MPVEYERPAMYPKQLAAMFCPERYSFIEASTKSGKTVSAMAWLLEQALIGEQKGRNYWWIAPGYNQAEIAYRRFKEGLTPGSFTATESPTPKITLLSGGVLWFKSGDNADSLYGEDVWAAVIDEASRVKEDSWHAVRSTLTNTNGLLRCIGNVKGRKNWFYQLCRKAEAEMLAEPDETKRRTHFAKITALDAIDAGVTDPEELEDARALLPDNIFKELYYAIPSDDAGNPFGPIHIAACTVDALAPGPAAAFGIDLAKSQDWFVIIGLNEFGGVCVFERWQQVPWKVSIDRVRQIVGEDVRALVDSTGLGDPVLEQLQYEHSNFEGFHFSATSKQRLMEGLAVAIQSREISFPKGLIPIELDNFEYVYSKTGVKYAAMEGFHDDCVAALALARQAWSAQPAGQNMMTYYKSLADKTKKIDALRTPEVDQRPNQPDPLEAQLRNIFENELAKAYEDSVVDTIGPDSGNLCHACGKPVGVTRSSDGEFIWHPEHSGLSPAQWARLKIREPA